MSNEWLLGSFEEARIASRRQIHMSFHLFAAQTLWTHSCFVDTNCYGSSRLNEVVSPHLGYESLKIAHVFLNLKNRQPKGS